MKKVISLFLAGAVVAASCLTSFADDNVIDQNTPQDSEFVVEYNADPAYTVVIPESISLGESPVTKQIKVYGKDETKGVFIEPDDMVFVELGGSENELNVINDDEDAISYSVNDHDDVDYPIILAGCGTGQKATTDVVFKKTGKTVYTGTYTDTLTFNVYVMPVVDISKFEDDSYQAQDGDIITGTGSSDTHITVAHGAAVTLFNCNISSIASNNSHSWGGITLEGDGTVILTGTNTLKGGDTHYPGLYVPEGKTLTIEGSGSLNAIGKSDSVGIGGGNNINCGNIEILSGTIRASGGGVSAPGIGSGYGGKCGNITISGGNITAEGALYGPGIGGGYECECGDITISGGTVSAKGGNYAAGIGAGYYHSTCGNILLSGGSITAIGGTNAAAVGSGQESTCHDIIVKSTVTKVEVTKGGTNVPYFGKGGYGTIVGTVTIENGANVIEH